MSTKNLIGIGPAFPYNLSDIGGTSYSTDISRINQSLFLIFETEKGSRLMMPEFGSDLRKYRFDPLDKILMERLRHTIISDIKKWEPRISLVSVEFLTDSSMIDNSILYISITYSIINTPVTTSYVYPYKLSTYDTVEISY